jgi:hypothetical protein
MRARVGIALLGVSLICGCYDSRWGETKRAQTRNYARETPAELAPAEGGDPRDLAVMRVRFYRTPEYTTQTVDVDRQLKEAPPAEPPSAQAKLAEDVPQLRDADRALQEGTSGAPRRRRRGGVRDGEAALRGAPARARGPRASLPDRARQAEMGRRERRVRRRARAHAFAPMT